MTEAPRHPRDAEVFEYVLGTLSREEREAFARDMDGDAGLTASVRYWDERLADLAETVPPVTPSAGSFDRIAAGLESAPGESRVNVVALDDVLRLRRSRTVWRSVAAVASSMAAALAIFIAVDRGRIPGGGEGSLVAVVNRSGDLPALIVRVDQRSGTVQIRSVAAEVPPDRSLELWSIAPGSAPRSLGLVGPGTTQVSLPDGRGSIAADVLLAVTVEPPGGSPTGSATGPIVYTGKLIPER